MSDHRTKIIINSLKKFKTVSDLNIDATAGEM